MIIKQISVFVENTPGRLADVTGFLAEAGINLRALSIADTTDFGILRLVADQPELALRRLKHAGFAARESEVIGVEVPDHPGGLARIIALLRDAKVSIEYLYASLEHKADRAIVVLKVDDVAAALGALERHGVLTVQSF